MPRKVPSASHHDRLHSEYALRLIYRAEWFAVALMGTGSLLLLILALRP